MRLHLFMCTLLACTACNSAALAAPVMLISIDGLHPAYVTEPQRCKVELTHLRDFVTHGAYARGVVGVVPTITYPSHTTLLTGVAPAVHGIVANTTFDPLGVNREGWYWYAEDMRAPTLWQAAAQAKLTTASINWPVTVGDTHIDYLIPEFWRASTPDDLKLMRALARPEGLMRQLESKLGPFVDGYAEVVQDDAVRTKFTVELWKEHKPDFLATHLIALDGTEHHEGPFTAAACETLQSLDGMIGELAAAAIARDPSSIVVIVSDHGFIATHTTVNLATRFVDAGLIKLKQSATPAVEAWDAQIWPGGGVGAVVLRDRSDQVVRAKVAKLLHELKGDPRNGIVRVLDKSELAKLGGFPGAEFLVEFAPGFYLGTGLRGDLLTPAALKGMHGYLPERPEMHSVFFVKGKGIAEGRDLGVIDMRRIAPTLAKLLQIRMTGSLQPALPIEASGQSHSE